MDLLSALMWLTLNVYHEARSEDQLAQVAVAHVTINRVKERKQSIKEVVLDPKQFSWTHTQRSWTPTDIKALLECFKSSIIAVKGYDFTKGSTHYHRQDKKPIWRKNLTLVTQIGTHKFYKERLIIRAIPKKIKH
jgi:N-acetylmuramoyl-L-alanine amidase